MSKVFDAVVIGAGINGSSAALHLARAGKRTVLVDQFPVPHSRGSSTGQSRVFCFANASFPSFTQMIQDSHQQWKDLEKEAGISLLRPNKLITVSNPSERKSIEKMYQSVIDCGFDPKWKSIEDVNNEYKTTFPEDFSATEDESAGVLMADKCLRTIQNLFVSSGGQIIEEFPIESILPNQNGPVTIEGPKGIIKGSYLIICAGAWTTRLLDPFGIHLPIKPIKVVVYYWKLVDATRESFLFLDLNNSEEAFYGIPSVEYEGLMKICYHSGLPCNPDNRDSTDMSPVKSKLMKYVSSNFPWLHNEPAIEESCMYTMSADRQMILDRHPHHGNIVYGCGFSGTGFKTGPSVGKALTEMVLGLKQSFDVSEFSLKRFQQLEK